MKILRAVGREIAATGRSLRYDLHRGRRVRGGGPAGGWPATPFNQPAAGDRRRLDPPGRTAELPALDRREYPEYRAYHRRPRRLRTALMVATLVVGGTTVAYLGVLGGLSSLLAQDSAPVTALPASGDHRSPAASGGTGSGGPVGGLGTSPAPPAGAEAGPLPVTPPITPPVTPLVTSPAPSPPATASPLPPSLPAHSTGPPQRGPIVPSHPAPSPKPSPTEEPSPTPPGSPEPSPTSTESPTSEPAQPAAALAS